MGTADNTQNIDATGAEALMSYRDKFHSKIKSKYPDVGEDEEGIYSKAYEDYEGLEKYQEVNRATNKQIAEVLTSYPELAKMIKGISEGMSMREAAARFMDVEGLTKMEGDPDYEGMSAAKAERMKAMEEQETYAKEFDENVGMSQSEIKAFAEENKMSEDEVSEFINDIDGAISDIHKGKISKDFLTKWRKGFYYDTDVAAAAEQAAIDAKNEKIDMSKAARATASDGMPLITGGDTDMPEKNIKKSDKIFMEAANPKRMNMIK